ncbi:LPS assembly lipoprotein LptE [Luteimonas aquatica]|uniref:LPS-assembly lipoprotein LptE n=1 Tax=Luteimonas aquatica TaxID=450364 RepID=UPI001F56F32C|nr:LPS assembly lipoprotein LptE [Luteimonas aquatica]
MTAAPTRPRLLRGAAIAVLALVLSACGFHLRSALTLPQDVGPIRVVARNPYSPLAQSVVQALERAGADATAEGAVDGKAVLNIRSEKWGSLPISVDQFGRSQEYTLRYAVVFSFTRADGTVFVPQQVVEMARDYISSPTNATGAESEAELLGKEMRKDMTAAILRRIDVAARSPRPATPVEPTDATLPDPTAPP